MLNAVQKYTRFIVFAFILASIASCGQGSEKEQNKHKDLTLMLQASFEKLYYAKYALDFPHTESALNHCVEYNNEPCIKVYKHFKDAKNTLLSLFSDKSLTATLNIIEQACLSKEENMATNICYGGIMSLYFYNSPEQDAVIFKRMREYPKAIQNMVFNHNFFWFHNRPSYINWNEYISMLDIEWVRKNKKQSTMTQFKKSIDEVGGEPWVLR